jgi:hypothetical protein
VFGVHKTSANYNQSSLILPELHARRGIWWFTVGDLRCQLW